MKRVGLGFFSLQKWPSEIHLALECVHEPHDLVSTGVSFKEKFPFWSAMTAPQKRLRDLGGDSA
jgi:hypothetical protein